MTTRIARRFHRSGRWLAAHGRAVLSLLPLAACASIVSSPVHPVQINTQPVGAHVIVLNDGGDVVFEGTTPAIVPLAAGRGFFRGANYQLSVEKPGYEPIDGRVPRSLNLWYSVGNGMLGFGGAIGWLIVDPLTGAMWSLAPVNLVLTPTETAAP
jgi:hypothetical protein